MAIFKKKIDKKKLKIPVIIKKNILSALLKKATIPIVGICLILLLYMGIKSIFMKSSYFMIKKINIIAEGYYKILADSELLKSCKEKNIFTVDIKNIAGAIHQNHPELKNVKVNRIMPDVLQVEIVERKPIALIKTSKYFPVDKESVILIPVKEIKESLPIISGISAWTRPRVGEVFRSNRAREALLLLEGIHEADLLKKYKVEEVDVSNRRNTTFFLNNGLEVRIGYGKLKEKLKKLSAILNDPKINVNNLQYIDLRFKDAILGPK